MAQIPRLATVVPAWDFQHLAGCIHVFTASSPWAHPQDNLPLTLPHLHKAEGEKWLRLSG